MAKVNTFIMFYILYIYIIPIKKYWILPNTQSRTQNHFTLCTDIINYTKITWIHIEIRDLTNVLLIGSAFLFLKTCLLVHSCSILAARSVAQCTDMYNFWLLTDLSDMPQLFASMCTGAYWLKKNHYLYVKQRLRTIIYNYHMLPPAIKYMYCHVVGLLKCSR